MSLRRPDACGTCAAPLAVGERAGWDADTRTTHCLNCVGALQPTPPGPRPAATTATARPSEQRAGGSAQREFEKRASRREQRIRSAHPKLGGLLLALSNDPVSTRVWAQGAAGERAVAAKLDELAGEHVVALHDRAQRRADGGRSRANIDHMAITATGVWVVDAKTHHGALEVRSSGGWLSPRVEALYIGGRDQTKLVVGLQKQVAAVAAELSSVHANIAVRGALCFVGTELPWFGNSSIAGVPLVGRRGLAKLLRAPGDLSPQDRRLICDFLETRFVPAIA